MTAKPATQESPDPETRARRLVFDVLAYIHRTEGSGTSSVYLTTIKQMVMEEADTILEEYGIVVDPQIWASAPIGDVETHYLVRGDDEVYARYHKEANAYRYAYERLVDRAEMLPVVAAAPGGQQA